MITAGDFRKGVTIEWEGGVWTIVDFQHVKPGKGAAFVRTKLKNVMTGAVVERSFNPTDKQPRATIETKEMQYVYNDGEFYYFMDQETFEQIPLTLDQVEDAIRFMKEETMATVRFFKGDTTSNTTKPATLETGYQISVPLFINIGDKIRVDTRDGSYMSRA